MTTRNEQEVEGKKGTKEIPAKITWTGTRDLASLQTE